MGGGFKAMAILHKFAAEFSGCRRHCTGRHRAPLSCHAPIWCDQCAGKTPQM